MRPGCCSVSALSPLRRRSTASVSRSAGFVSPAARASAMRASSFAMASMLRQRTMRPFRCAPPGVPMRLPSLILAAAMSAASLPALAAPACLPPANLAPALVVTPPAGEIVTGVTNAFYLLALNWTPQWCRTMGVGTTAQKMECAQAFGFTLHGLWPNGAARPYPRFCRPVASLDTSTVAEMYCRTPSAELLQHEWHAHGACGWGDPKAYVNRAAKPCARSAMPH